MNQTRWLTLYQVAAGLCDTSTGVALVAAPILTLHLMGLTLIPQPVAFVQYIGVFVLGVGLTYLWAAVRWPLDRRGSIKWRTQWQITAMIRTLVALFVIWQVISQSIEPRWISVAASDGALALIQWIGLSKNWLDHAE